MNRIFRRVKIIVGRSVRRVKRFVEYVTSGVWCDTKQSFKVNAIKTLNLSVRSFLNGDLQSRACAMTYRTVLAIVPALAILFAIGRGFGLRNVLKDELIANFASQKELLNKAFSFVDSYLGQSSEGLFVGVGIVLLLWTLISLLGSVENAFNMIWGVKSGRSIWRKITDYLAIFLILPVLMICASGITVLVSSTVEKMLPLEFISPLLSVILDVASLVLTWLFFTGAYMLIPNTKVKFKNAFLAGVLAGTAFIILQWLFITGTLYVSKYNAIYGSFAFLPLLLIWLQLVWVICLSGAVVCYASQNIFQYNFSREIANISLNYRSKIAVSLMTVIVGNYDRGELPITEREISVKYAFPPSLAAKTLNMLVDAGLLLRVVIDNKSEVIGYAPAIEPSKLTIADVLTRVDNIGTTEFVPGFEKRFSQVISHMDIIDRACDAEAAKYLIRDLNVSSLETKA